MSDEETRQLRAEKMRRRREEARDMLDRSGPYKPKIVNPKKGGEYKRQKHKIDKKRIEDYVEE